MNDYTSTVEKLMGGPPPTGTDGAALLDDVRHFIRKFCAFPTDACLTAVTLWTAHAHCIEHFHTSPRLMISSPEPASGKSRVLEVLDLLVPESMLSLSPSPATIFRTLEQRQITLLMDEVDAIWNSRGKDDNHEDLRALLNAGYRRGATIPRCVGPKHEVVNFDVYCATALAGLGDLPDTIMSRSVIIRMRRRGPYEHVEPFRIRVDAPAGYSIRDRLAEWADGIGAAAGDAWPDLPPGIVDRPAEIWEPLLAIADAAGGHWPETARVACVELCKVADDRKVSLGIRLLDDLRTVFGDADALHAETVIERLCDPDANGLPADAPWNDLYGKQISKRQLASMLKKYNVTPTKVKVAGAALQGYRREHLWDAWERYLPSLSAEVEPPEPSAPPQDSCGFAAGSEGSVSDFRPEPQEPSGARVVTDPVPQVPEVPDFQTPESALAEACTGTTWTPEDLRAELADDDLRDLAAGRIGAAELRTFINLRGVRP